MKKIFNKLKRVDPLIVIIIAIVLIVLIQILTVTTDIKLFENQNKIESLDEIQAQTNENFLEERKVTYENYPESKELLKALPYISDDFTVNNLPLEEDSKANVVVYLINPGSEEKFKNWLAQYIYNEDEINFIYQKSDLIESDVETF